MLDYIFPINHWGKISLQKQTYNSESYINSRIDLGIVFFSQYFIPPQADQPLTEIREGALYFCLEQRLVTVRDQVIPLTVKEFEIFALLILNPKRVFTYEMLMELVWHEEYSYYSRKAINNHISNLRKKLKVAHGFPEYVKSVYGVGYKFEV